MKQSLKIILDIDAMKMSRCIILLLTGMLVFASCRKAGEEGSVLSPSTTVENGTVIVNPYEYYQPFRNPMKGLREFFGPGVDARRAEYPYPYGSMIKEYMQWNMMENVESDGVDKVIAYSDHRWEGVEDLNVKVIPRPFIVWMEEYEGGVEKNTYTDHPDDLNGWHWPSDIPREVRSDDNDTPSTGGYFDPSFQDRVKKFVKKLGEAWDNDPRVAYVEMGIIGEWGEHHDPNISTDWAPHTQPYHVANRTWIPGIEKTLGDAFKEAFKNKKVMIRYAYEFDDYDFGVYWDSWAIDEEIERGYNAMLARGDYWKDQVVGGEITWGWGSLYNSGYRSFEDCVGNSGTRKLIIDQIRELHCNHLGGVTWANFQNSSFLPNAGLVQKALGYRFLISDFRYPARISAGEPFDVSFTVVNTGSSPFYYDWPIEISILDAETKKPVWSSILGDVRISEWMPGENWNGGSYTVPAPENKVFSTLTVDKELEPGKYIISVACLDPAGMLPSLRFAAMNYFTGGRHPMGYIGVEQDIDDYEVPMSSFDDMQSDHTLRYVYEKE